MSDTLITEAEAAHDHALRHWTFDGHTRMRIGSEAHESTTGCSPARASPSSPLTEEEVIKRANKS